MVRKVASIYAIILGVSIIAMWSMIIITGGITEGPIEITFHIISEFIMAFLLLVGGVELLRRKGYGKKIFLISNGMLVYSVLNAVGYYGERNDFVMLSMFMVIFIISSGFLVLGLTRDKYFTKVADTL